MFGSLAQRYAAHPLPPSVHRFTKFSLIGGSGVIVNLAVFWSLTSSWLHLHYLIASALAIEVAICSNYLLNNNWTFGDRTSSVADLKGLTRYHAVSFGGMLINLAVLQLVAGLLGMPPVLGNLLGIGIATIWNFTINLGWTWRLHKAPAAAFSA